MSFLKTLPRNTRTCVLVEPLWTLFGPATFFYGPLYMKEIGLSEIEIGTVNSIGLAFSFLFFLLAGPLTDKLGRNRASTIFDIIAWPVAMVLWGLATGFWWFVAAVVANSVVRIVIVSWNLLMTEDAAKESRVKVFGIVSVMSACGGFVTMGAGFLRDSLGLEPVMRGLYLVGAASMLTMIIIRALRAPETANGRAMMEQTRGKPLLGLVAEQVRSFINAAKDREFLRIVAFYFIVNATVSFNAFQAIYAKELLGYREAQIAWVPGVNALATLALFLLVIPRLARAGGERLGLALSFGMSMVASACFMVMPGEGLPFLLGAFALGGTAFQLTLTYRETVFMNHSHEATRAELFGIVQALGMLLSIPTGYLAGLLYSASPVAPFAVNIGLFGLGAFLALRLRMSKSTHGAAE